jgi:hypothetical protein
MKNIITLLIVCTLCLTGRAGTTAMLSGIRVVETQDQLHPPRGKLGERGPYQFRRSTWRMHTSSSFELAENREVADVVAKRHYAWIETQLAAHGIEASPYNVAVAWNAGVNGVIRGTAPAGSHDYANRVLNIASTLVEPAAIPNEMPRPAWQAPVLVSNETVSKPEKPVAPAAVLTVVATQPKQYVVSTDSPGRRDLIEVRYQSDPIMLAFSGSGVL